MGVKVFPAEAGGELDGADKDGGDSGEDVRDEVEAVGDHASVRGICGSEDGRS